MNDANVIVVDDEPEIRETVSEYLELHGIETREMMPLTNQPALSKYLRFEADAIPATEWINRTMFQTGPPYPVAGRKAGTAMPTRMLTLPESRSPQRRRVGASS